MPGGNQRWSLDVAGKFTCGHCSVPSTAAPDFALSIVEGDQSHCYHQKGILLNI